MFTKIFQSSVLTLTILSFSKLFIFLSLYFISINAGVEIFGVFNFWFLVGNTLILISLFGLQNNILKFGVPFVNSPNEGRLLKIYNFNLKITILISIFISTVLTIFLLFFHRNSIISVQELIFALLIIASVPFGVLITMKSYLYRALQNPWPEVFTRNLLRSFIFLILILVLINTELVKSLWHLGLIYFVSFFLTFLVINFLKVKDLSVEKEENFSFDKKKYFLFAFYTSSSVILYELMMLFDKSVLSFYGQDYALGIYSFGSLLSRQIDTIGIALMTIVTPLINRSDLNFRGKSLLKICFFLFFLSTIFFSFLYIFSGNLFSYFAASFIEGEIIFLILSLGHLSLLITIPLSLSLQFSGFIHQDLKFVGLAFLLNIILCLFLYTYLGELGLAISTSISLAFLSMSRLLFFVLKLKQNKL